MRVKKIVKCFTFDERIRNELTIGTNTRLNPQEHRLQLEELDSGYPTTPDLYIKTRVFNPKSVKRFVGFDVYDFHEKDYTNTPYTSLGFRLNDGTNDLYWNGVSWEINVVDWNTEEEIASNIDTFPVTAKKLQVVINLVTTNSLYTPFVYEIRVLYESNIDFQDDLLYASLVPAFRNINPISDQIVTLTSTTTTIDLDDFPLESPYNVVDIDSCFNYTDDPGFETDIFSSYDSNTKIITLTGSVDSGKQVWIKFVYQPVVAVSTDQEYAEVSETPAIHFLNVDTLKNNRVTHYTAVRNKSSKKAVKATNLRQRSFEFTVSAVTNLAIDQQRLQDEIRQFFVDNLLINFNGLDENFAIFISADFSAQTAIQNMATYSSVFRFIVADIVYFMQVEENVNIVENFVISGDMDLTI